MADNHKTLQDELCGLDVLYRHAHVCYFIHLSRLHEINVISLSRRKDQYDDARSLFSDLAYKNLDWPEAIWEAWISFEHQHGSVAELEACLDKVERAQYQVNMRRATVSILLDSLLT